jgi:PAT family beta-lactamase induction signal transducer AmpG
LPNLPTHPPPWLFGITGLPGGVFQGFLSVAMPFLLRRSGVPVQQIATISAAANIPIIYYFLWSPIVDMGLKRRTWLVLSATTSAVCAYAAFLVPIPAQLSWLTFLLILASALNMVVSSSNGALMASTLPVDLRGRASGWYQCANVGGVAIGGGVLLWIGESLSLSSTALALGILITLPSLAALLITEPVYGRIGTVHTWRVMLQEVWAILKSRAGLVGLVFFIAPVNAGALMNLFSAVAADFHAPAKAVTWITGIAGGLLSAAGSLVGGFLCDRLGRRNVYMLSGALFLVCCVAMALGPLVPWVYIAGSSVYLFVLGIAYASFTALVLDVIGTGGRSAATSYSLFVASGNIPVVFMTWFDGKGYGAFGPRGLLGFDALGNLVGLLIVVALVRFALTTQPAPISAAHAD